MQKIHQMIGDKKKQLDDLFIEWEDSVPGYKGHFKKDGIINEDLFEIQGLKLLFIGKEPHDEDQSPGNYRKWWGGGAVDKLSTGIGKWAYWILSDFTSPPPTSNNDRDNSIKKIAFLNIKKTGGGRVSSLYEICSHLELNRTYLKRELDIIQPDIIISCFITWPGFIEKFMRSGFEKVNHHGFYVYTWRGYKMIDHYHPSQFTISDYKNFELLKELIKL